MKGKQVSPEAVRKIVLLLAQGKHEKEIAEEYNISPDTVYKIRDAHIEALQTELDSSISALNTAIEQGRSEAAANSASEQTAAAGIGADTSNIAESAGSAASSLKGTTEDLKYMRDIAEQEAINRFTTAEVKIDMTGMTNRIDSNMDLDGVLNTFTEGFAEALEVAAEGVHA